jgi:site-specific DNA-cytosine methylase
MTAIVIDNGKISPRENISHAIDANYGKGLDNPRERTGLVEVARLAGHQDRQTGRIYHPSGIARTMCSGVGGMGKNSGLYEIKGRVRRLTPVECERLQAFPDRWTEGISDTQRYKCLGNAVTVSVVEYILRRLN